MSGLFVLWVKFLCGASPIWQGCPPDSRKTRLYFANHGSNLDFVALWSALPPSLRRKTRPVAALDYWSQGRVRPWVAERVFQALLIARTGVTRSNNPLDQMVEALQNGDSLIIFPEGTRHSEGDTIGEFKSGLYHLTRKCPEVELVPVYLQNLNRVMPKGEILPIPFLCSVVFGEPIRLEEGERKAAFLERARSRLFTLKEFIES